MNFRLFYTACITTILYNMEMKVNTQKTKIMTFSRAKIRNIPNFVYNGSTMELVFSFRYLGLT